MYKQSFDTTSTSVSLILYRTEMDDTYSCTFQRYRDRYFQDITFEALQHIEPVVRKHNLTLVETALRWCVHHSQLKFAKDGGNDGVIIGVSSLKQLEGNLKDLEKGPLPEEVVQGLDQAWDGYFKYRGPSYWR